MISYLIKLRFKIILRALLDLGTIRIIIFIPFFLLLLVGLNSYAKDMTGAVLLTVLNTAVMLNIQALRTDKNFLKKFTHRSRQVLFTEYAFYSLPLILILMLNGHIILAVLTLSLNLPVTFVNIELSMSGKGKKIRTYFPFTLFEWNSSFRERIISVSIIYIASIILSRYLTAILAGIFILGVIFAFFYVESESRKFVETFMLSSGRFLLRKILLALSAFIIIISPLVILCAVLHYRYILFLAVSVLLSAIIITNGILIKYAFYEEGSNISFYTTTLISINIAFFIAIATMQIYLVPIPVIMGLWLFRKAKQNLNYYLYAYD